MKHAIILQTQALKLYAKPINAKRTKKNLQTQPQRKPANTVKHQTCKSCPKPSLKVLLATCPEDLITPGFNLPLISNSKERMQIDRPQDSAIVKTASKILFFVFAINSGTRVRFV